jgi:hypothetical protein
MEALAMTKGEWAGWMAGAAGVALAAQAAWSVGRGVASAVSGAPPLVKLACLSGAAAIVLAVWQALEDDRTDSPCA